ncbi:MAG: phosphopantothenoylcysteine decarboxylase [Candidatus Omnitrophica bacterium]|nr:phosphopantothenoylcysteine decarboxylase [Candidatus Omnitrophota bacterium]
MQVLITCGPTREAIDPVRYLSNHSTGIMGFEIAKAFRKKGYSVTLLHGPVHVPALPQIRKIPFESALDLQKLLKKHIVSADILVMAAAVSDYRPVQVSHKKLKKTHGTPALKLKKNPDLLKGLKSSKKKKIFVGFCVESENVIRHAKSKLTSKSLDLIIAQKAAIKKTPFGNVKPDVWIVNRDLSVEHCRKISKHRLAIKLETIVTKSISG